MNNSRKGLKQKPDFTAAPVSPEALQSTSQDLQDFKYLSDGNCLPRLLEFPKPLLSLVAPFPRDRKEETESEARPRAEWSPVSTFSTRYRVQLLRSLTSAI